MPVEPAVPIEVVAIGCSAGGLSALRRLLGALDGPLPAALVVVCHTGSPDGRLLQRVLAGYTPMPVAAAEPPRRPTRGELHVASPGYHLLTEPGGDYALTVDAREHHVRPAIDPLFESAAIAYGPRLAGVVMTGSNADGAAGLAQIRRRGGLAIVQSPDDAEFDVMPKAALAFAGADHCLPVEQIGALLWRICRHG